MTYVSVSRTPRGKLCLVRRKTLLRPQSSSSTTTQPSSPRPFNWFPQQTSVVHDVHRNARAQHIPEARIHAHGEEMARSQQWKFPAFGEQVAMEQMRFRLASEGQSDAATRPCFGRGDLHNGNNPWDIEEWLDGVETELSYDAVGTEGWGGGTELGTKSGSFDRIVGKRRVVAICGWIRRRGLLEVTEEGGTNAGVYVSRCR
ncbi:uncharacterized protein EI97DRAFT_445027 [Westerdykella ornata]|uniref:Uncharacterized protein n=1 Tax=Westerdykella ornata TaxID=318751 RepID=A0A6A6JAJ5_WESOR|nr:uncharacterized protein EI97DRAFT_445027 [Westerdykella ornata]KAF2273287.1 hypothetical protein EI97DRAFT_445027 [Westerdykella ornata]